MKRKRTCGRCPKFEGVQKSGGGWVAKCPSHGDDNPSLSIARGEDGRWLVHCHAGCTAEQMRRKHGFKKRGKAS